MGFEVVEEDLEAAAESFRELAADTSLVHRYVDQYLNGEYWSNRGMFATSRATVTNTMHTLLAVVENLRTALDASAEELDLAAALYRGTDESVRATMDNTYVPDPALPAGQRYDDVVRPFEDTVPEQPADGFVAPSAPVPPSGGGGGSW
ncbi:hypothetical protein [Nocardioides limicola]|uniref:hypothetical protein n=1 Tax=Nocardioides limicola TaxID=2803368 RepID=UPI00193C4A01|nr:hypothetical protein [Nocardioides sp. DJM-14]